MTIDPRTMLFMTNAVAFVASAFLLFEWHLLRERSLAYWSAGFAAIVLGCAITPLREAGFFIAGVWLANGLLVTAHLAFLYGTAAFLGRRVSPGWCLTLPVWGLMLAIPDDASRTQVLSMMNALLVAVLSLKSGHMLGGLRQHRNPDSALLAFAFLAHGGFYLFKTLTAFVPGAFVNLFHYTGLMILVSLFEGIMMEVALALSIVGALRRRRERSIVRLAEHDPLTGLLNRRGFDVRARAALEEEGAPAALLLLDIDHFKSINDGYGHPEGDRLLVALGVFLNSTLPGHAIWARLGGDEFAILLPRTDSFAAQSLAKALCRGFASVGGGRGNGGTLSIGCATQSAGAIDLETLFGVADRALYDAKRQGRNRPSHREVGAESVAPPAPRDRAFRSAIPLVTLPVDAPRPREIVPTR
ncbi:diguanylate cyclase domain-containing protein [Novosphingobium sp. YAF33]|uniref:GGDEF domain-containing protein n=1 Tax=Novosphingobium sp. YAF33 TaxID=3233082 RepID=UPI003F9968F0